MLGTGALAQVGQTDMRAWMAAERQRGLGARSLARALSAVKSFYQWLGERDGFEPTAVLATRSPKYQRKLEAAQREKRNKVLKPLEQEFEEVEKKIAELEGAQATLTEQLSSPEVAGDADQFRQVSEAIAKLAKSLENGYSRWDELSDEIDQVKEELGVE